MNKYYTFWDLINMFPFCSPLLLVLSPAQESHVNMDLPPVSEQIMQTLSELAKSFQDMADRCLLVLHLEVRYDPSKHRTLWCQGPRDVSQVPSLDAWRTTTIFSFCC